MQLLCTIRQSPEGSRYEFLVRDPSRASITVSNERPVLGSDLARISRSIAAFRETLQPSSWNAPSVDERLAALERVGEEIASYLLPQPVYNLLSDPTLEGATLTLETNELQIPWEVARIQGRWLWERFRVARQQIFEARREGTPGAWLSGSTAAPRSTLRVLVVADPEDSLPTARQEAQTLAAMFSKAPGWEVEALVGEQATSGVLVDRLQSRAFDILHLACTAVYDPRDPAQSRLFLADEPLPARRLGDVRFAARPRLVFMNACQAGREDQERPLLSRTSGWGRLFLALGAEAIVGPLWDVRDQAAVRLSETFYGALLDGSGVAEALLRGRRALVGDQDPFLSAHAYVIYGNPTLRLAPAAAQEAATEAWVLKPRFHLRVRSGPQEGRIIPLLPKTMLEGRRIPIGGPGARRNDIDLGDPGLSNDEAALVYSGGAYHLVNESGQVRVDGAAPPSGERLRLGGGETLAMGASIVEFVAGAPGEPAQARCALEVVAGPARGQRFNLPQQNAEIGRAADCAVRLDDPSVSRRHATLAPRDAGWELVPRSANPTLVNGIALEGPRALEDGDEIQLSEESVLRFVLAP
jgi:hypothetical protein